MNPAVLAELIATLEPEAYALIVLLVHKLKGTAPVADPIPTPLPVPPANP